MDTQPLALPVDYYELLDLAPAHLFAPEPERRRRDGRAPRLGQPAPAEQLEPGAVDAAAIRAEATTAANPALSAGARALRLAEIELGRRILRDADRRRRYDALRWPGADATARAEQLRRLRELQVEAQAENASPDAPSVADDGQQLFAKGVEAMRQNDYAGASRILRRAAAQLPHSADAQLAFVRAVCAAGDPLALGEHALRGLAEALALARRASPEQPAIAPLAHLVAGLLARDSGDRRGARLQFEEALHLQPNLAPAWRGLAALHLAENNYSAAAEAAHRAFNADERDEAPLHILLVAAVRSGQESLAHAAARRIAAMRGAPWTVAAIRREFGLS